MAIEDDVFVIGGGIAGMTAALAAAEQGVSVRVARKKQSTLRQATGLGDVLGYVSGTLVSDPFDALDELPARHPYSIVGESALRAGLERFDAVTGDAYRGGQTDRNALVLTPGGSVKPTARYPRSMASGLANDQRDMLLVGFDRVVDFDAPVVAAHLAHTGVPFDSRGETIRFPLEFQPDATMTRYACALDADENGVRDRLAQRVGRIHEGEPRVGFPALLGLDDPNGVRQFLARTLGADVFEVPMGPPSLPGVRLESMFQAAVADAGVNVVQNEVVDYESQGRTITGVLVDRNGQHIRYDADAFVLATGGLVGTGLTSDRDGVREPVFDLHVSHPDHRDDWYVDEPYGNQPFPRFGVDVDDQLRPRTENGSIAFDNLRAAGSVLGGFDFAASCSGTGVSLGTGQFGGRTAAEVDQ